MPTLQILFRHYLLIFTGLLLLGSCQRATYSFQAVGAHPLATQPHSAADSLAAPTDAEAPLPGAVQPPSASRHNRPARWRQQSVVGKVSEARRLMAGPQLAPPTAAAQRPTQGQRVLVVNPAQEDQPRPQHRSRLFAIVLAALSFTYLPLSLHNFYLGYYGRGAVAIGLLIVGTSLFLLGVPDLVFGTSALLPIGYVGIALLASWFVWQFSDFIRIISNNLQPRNGEYSRRAPVVPAAIELPAR